MNDAVSRRDAGLRSCLRKLGEQRFNCALGGQTLIRRYLLKPRDAEGVADLLTTVFTEREPLSLALDIGYEDMKAFSRTACDLASRSGLSAVAKDAEGQIVGFALGENWPALPREDPLLGDCYPHMAPIFALLSSCKKAFDAAHISDNQALHIVCVGVCAQHRNRGITKLLVADIMALAAESGIARALTEATGLSWHLFASLGFETTHEVFYRSFVFDNTRPFAGITGVPSTKVMEKLSALNGSHLNNPEVVPKRCVSGMKYCPLQRCYPDTSWHVLAPAHIDEYRIFAYGVHCRSNGRAQ
ncbi:GNAT family N-acetyltransferase [Paraburkholderia mimosarum]|uniref:GNAT family N-acetyltransferase n=1 Tax=Paraburkholderia mimosarum TaxID=312026 RepID=UPI0004829DEF|nr:GNAT family N-acetyltransferase [Paraburkholderia mimosarum]